VFHKKLCNFLNNWETDSFSIRTLRPSIIGTTQLATSFLRFNNNQSANTSARRTVIYRISLALVTRNRPKGPEGSGDGQRCSSTLSWPRRQKGWVVSTTPRPLYHRERPGTHCTGGWVGPRAGLDVCGKSRIKSKKKNMFYKKWETNFYAVTKNKFGNFTRSHVSFIKRMTGHEAWNWCHIRKVPPHGEL
jgi:hypothetical protein